MCREGADDRGAKGGHPGNRLLGNVPDLSLAPTEGAEMIETLAPLPVIHGLDPSNHGGPTRRDADEDRI